VAHTVLCAEDTAAPIPEGKARDVIMACATAAETILANIKPGVTNNDLTPLFQRVAESYGVNVCEGVLSHQMKRFVIDGNKVILSKLVPGEQAVDEDTFELNDVIGIDIIMSSGEGKPREVDEKKQMVYKRAVDKNYNLKMKVSREIFSQIIGDHPTLPFSLREYDGVRARLGMKECLEHELFTSYPVLEEKEGEYVAHFKYTVFLGEEGVQRVTGGILPNVEADAICKDEELAGFYNAYVEKVAKKAAKKKKGKKK
jgi:curved DNA binding protein